MELRRLVSALTVTRRPVGLGRCVTWIVGARSTSPPMPLSTCRIRSCVHVRNAERRTPPTRRISGECNTGHHIGLMRRGTSSHDSSVRRATLRSPTHGACEYPLGAVALSLPLASLFGARTVVLSGRDRRVASHPDALARLSTSSPPRIRALTCAPSWQGARRPRAAVPSGMV